MKQCPQCSQTYFDDTNFCLSDGATLIFVNDKPEEVTLVQAIPEELTFVKPVQKTQPTIIPSVQPVQSGVSPIFAYLSVALLLLLIIGGAFGLGVFVLSRLSDGNTNTELAKINNKNSIDNGQNKVNDQQANLQKQQEQIEKEKQRLANERQKLDEIKNKPISTPVPPPVPTPPVNYPPQPTARIKFGRGRVSESVSGKVYTQRSFVLEAMSGQYLSAAVNGGGCVTFSNGGTSAGFTTVKGDNRLTLVNNCRTEASFSMTVTIR